MSEPREIRWGILGTAHIASTFAGAASAVPGSRVTAVASRDADRAAAWARAHGIPRAFGSYETLLAEGEIDALYLPLPNSLHARWTMRAIEAGIPVLCEKPLTVNAEEAAEVARRSREFDVLVAEAFMYRHHPQYERVLGLLREGAIGTLRLIQASFSFFLDDRSEIPASAALGGGALRDVGCYGVNLARLVTGTEPTRVFAAAHGPEVDDTLVGVLEFPGGVLACIDCSIECEERRRAEIVGTEGTIVLDRPWLPSLEGAEIRLRRGGVEERIAVPGACGYRLEIADFAEAIRTGRDARWPVTDAVANMAVLDALLASAGDGMPRDLPDRRARDGV
ncbi:MAG: Gfo/Idh/MocA family oxidoreductase [Myxococcales bacterium]|nr:Gfo/Idh/MocA family oxidoreductase [Myxococcales bacterium]